jgi:LEA14-like dessication related protein
MRINNLSLAFLSVAFCLLFSGCIDVSTIKIVDIESLKVLRMDETGAEIELMVKIKNPNSLGFTIVDSDLKASMGTMELGNAALKNKVKVPANSEESHRFVIESTFSGSLMKNLGSLFLALKTPSTEIHLQGKLKGKSWGFSKTIPIDVKEKVPALQF